MRFATLSSLLVPFAFACSSSSASPAATGGNAGAAGAGGSAPDPIAAYAAYCTGTLKVEQKIQQPAGPGAWSGTGMKVAAGTTFLVAAEQSSWGGIVITADGSPERISPVDFKTGLVKDTDFTADCATDDASSSPKVHIVLLAKSTFYASMDFSGAGCTLDAGTALDGFNFSSLGGASSVSAQAIKSKCGIDTAYTKDLVYGSLEAKLKSRRRRAVGPAVLPHGRGGRDARSVPATPPDGRRPLTPFALLEPWTLARLVSGLAAALLLAHAARVSAKVLSHHRVGETAEGQLALERQTELAATAARVGAALTALSLLLSVLAADRLAGSLRGAMCGFGVVHASAWGPTSIALSIGTAVAAGAYLQLLRLDRATRDLSLVRVTSTGALPIAALAIVDLAAAWAWLGGIDRDVVASCCSTGADAASSAAGAIGHDGPRVLTTVLGVVAVALAVALAFRAAKTSSRRLTAVAGVAALVALPLALATVVLEVAPHVYEVPHHRCPYCLFRIDAWGIGYPLFGAVLLAATWGSGAGLAAITARGDALSALPRVARVLLRREAVAWLIAAALGAFPIVRYAIVAGAPLFR